VTEAAAPPVGVAPEHALTFDVLDGLGMGVLIVAPDGTIDAVSAHGASMFGYRCDELLGASVEQLVPRHTRDVHARLRTEAGPGGVTRAMDASGRDLEGLHRDGSHLAVDVQLTPLPGGRTVAVVRDARPDRERAADLALTRVEVDAWRSAAHRRSAALDDVVQRVFGTVATLESCRPALGPGAAAHLDRCVTVLLETVALASAQA
jgi:PAS domain S-box-containing protein